VVLPDGFTWVIESMLSFVGSVALLLCHDGRRAGRVMTYRQTLTKPEDENMTEANAGHSDGRC